MVTLYKTSQNKIFYWEAWEDCEKNWVIHHGEIGTTGTTDTFKPSFFKTAQKKVENLLNKKCQEGFEEVPTDDFYILIIEYEIDGFGDEEDQERRYAIQDLMSETLGWTGLGICDGGSWGNNTLEICCYVIDYKKSLPIVKEALKDSNFNNYTRIYCENSDEDDYNARSDFNDSTLS